VVVTTELPGAAEATDVATQAFGRVVPLANVDKRLRSDIVLAARSGATVVGWASLDCLDGVTSFGKAVYLNGVVIRPACQSQGVAARFMATIAALDGVGVVVFRTQSPLAMHALASNASAIYPNPLGEEPPPELLALATATAEAHGGEYPLHVAGVGRQLYPQRPIHRDSSVQAWFDGMCPHPERGDALFFVAVL
jgi:hypothetical protein